MRVVRRIDRGGFGYVDEVALDDGSHVARKSFAAVHSDPAALSGLKRRFEREVRIQTAIRHPNIMPVLTSGLMDDPPWFTMPLATASLATKLERDHSDGRVDFSPWLDILAAVEELHRLGYVHRDLKPANVLLVDGRWAVSDFGLILPTMRDTTVLTGSGSAYGSRYYAAPEQTMDFRNTPEQADIYALGCMLQETIEPAPHRIPFAQIRISGPYAAVLEKCTELDHRRRFPTVSALRAALFDVWSVPPRTTDEGDPLLTVLDAPDSVEPWRRLIQHLEHEQDARRTALRAINSGLLLQLAALDDVLFARMVALLCAWASDTGFEWSYCDVVGDRLLDAYRVAPIRLRAGIVLAALELAASHNRFHVMTQVGGMLSAAADGGLVDRVLIEARLDREIETTLRSIERSIHWPRKHWHERLGAFLDARDEESGVE